MKQILLVSTLGMCEEQYGESAFGCIGLKSSHVFLSVFKFLGILS